MQQNFEQTLENNSHIFRNVPPILSENIVINKINRETITELQSEISEEIRIPIDNELR
jgi:hypothetical protein